MKKLRGTIVSTKMKNTVVVKVVAKRPHPMYKKLQQHTKRFLVDTADQMVGVGDMVDISEVRPISKNKYFKILNIVTKAAVSAKGFNEPKEEKK
ncbi:MAG: 30S ribosomal protein S17 [Patescibacteria group bacterium]